MLYLICNPTAGNGRAKHICNDIQTALTNKNIPYTCLFTSARGHATVLAAEAVSKGAESVLAIGGDGTAYEVATALKGTNTALGIIPAGTGNDFIKTLGYPRDPIQALEHILSHPPVKTDVGSMGDRIFLNEIGTGFDVTVLEYAEKAKKYCRGLLPYLYGVIRTMFSYKPLELTYKIDDEETVYEKALVCGVANGGIIGGGIVIAPEAKVDDGLFDVVIVRYIPRWRILPYLPKLLAGKVLTFPETIFCRAKKVTFSAPNMLVNIDGELQKLPQVTLSVAENALLIHR